MATPALSMPFITPLTAWGLMVIVRGHHIVRITNADQWSTASRVSPVVRVAVSTSLVGASLRKFLTALRWHCASVRPSQTLRYVPMLCQSQSTISIPQGSVTPLPDFLTSFVGEPLAKPNSQQCGGTVSPAMALRSSNAGFVGFGCVVGMTGGASNHRAARVDVS
jgi:hypothetical protein